MSFFKLHYKWSLVGLLFFAGFLNLEDRVVIFSVLPLIRRDLHLSDLQMGGLMSAFLWVYACCSPFAGYLGDRWSRRKVVIGCLFFWSLITAAAGLITDGNQLLAIRVLLAISQAFYLPASFALLSDWHESDTRGKAVAVLTVGMNAAPIVGGALAGWVGENYGWRVTLVLLGGVGTVLAGVMVPLLRERVSQAGRAGAEAAGPFEGFKRTLQDLIGTPSLVFIFAAMSTFSLAVWALLTWLPVYLHDRFGMTLTASGFLGNFAVSGPIVVGMLIGGYLSDKLGARKPSRRLLILITFYGLAAPWPLLFWQARQAVWILVATAVFQLCRALGEANYYPLIYELVVAERRSTSIGISNSLSSFAGGVGALVTAYFQSTLGLQATFALVSVLVLLAVAGLVVSYWWFFARDLAKAARPETALVPESSTARHAPAIPAR
ncbi:MAG: MFS transporter [Acidobacteriota bacterium]